MGVDVVVLPYHGPVDVADHDEVSRSKATSGTTHFFTSATAYAVVRGRRHTLTMCQVRVMRDLIAAEWPFILKTDTSSR